MMNYGNMLLSILLFCTLIIQKVQSNSFGIGIPICDAKSELLGCDKGNFRRNNRLECRNDNRYMSWAERAERTSRYTLFAGPSAMDKANMLTHYVRGKLHQIHIVTEERNAQFRGLLLYARDDNGNKVGEWELVNEHPQQFRHPVTCPNSIFHAHAHFKPYVNTFYFRAPNEDVGKITFEALIKYGDANHGAFYWPNEVEDFSLLPSEASSDNVVEWVRSNVGQSCNIACQNVNMECKADYLSIVHSATTIQSELMDNHICQFPLLSQCTKVGNTGDINDFCYFHMDESSCVQANRDYEFSNCGASSDITGRRFCPCVTNRRLSIRSNKNLHNLDIINNLEIADQRGLENSSAKPFVSCLTIMFGITLLARLKLCNRWIILIVLCCIYLPGIHAHNWVASMSRAFQASTKKPCIASLSDAPHIQVAPGQEFEIEWVTGHGGTGYFTVVHQGDEDKLSLVTEELLDAYLEAAPLNGGSILTGEHWEKYHRKADSGLYNPTVGSNNFWLKEVVEGDPNYFPQDQNITEALNLRQPGTTKLGHQFQYHDNQKANDKRAAYVNDDFPWIKSVHRFTFEALIPRGSNDFARFQIQNSNGRHVIHYMWRGYSDCVDVDVVDDVSLLNDQGHIDFIYGKTVDVELDVKPYKRIDHCVFPAMTRVIDNGCYEVVKDIGECERSCSRANSCAGIIVQPLQLPNTVYLKDSLLPPFQISPDNSVAERAYCDIVPFQEYLDQENAENMYVCYGAKPLAPTDTTEMIRTTEDSTDPEYYSTCFLKDSPREFVGGKVTSSNPMRWNPGRNCITCESQTIAALYSAIIPQWDNEIRSGDSGECINCDLEPVNLNTIDQADVLNSNLITSAFPHKSVDEVFKNMLVETSHTCDDSATNCSNRSCLKRLLPLGQPEQSFVSPETCYLLAQRDNDCSATIIYQTRARSDTPDCFCYLALDCCGDCVSTRASAFDIFRIP